MKRYILGERASLNFLFPLIFLFFYSVKFTGLPNFSHLGGVLIPFVFFLISKVGYSLKVITSSLKFWLLLAVFFMFLTLSVAVPFLHGTADFSLLPTIAHSIFIIPACMAISSLINNGRDDDPLGNIVNLLGWLLKLQVVFILLMLVSSDARDFVHGFVRTESQLDRMAVYQGSRGLGVSGSVAFGLSTQLAINYLLYFFMLYVSRCSSYKVIDYVWMGLGVIAMFSAGRTSVISVVFLPFAIFMYSVQFKKVSIKGFAFDSVVVAFVLSLFVFFYYIFGLSENESIQRYIFYVFQPVDHFLRTGSFEVSSLKGLNNMYYYPGDKTFIFGDGRYSSDSGGYYGSVDAGYMRYILYGGVFYQILCSVGFLYFCIIFNSVLKRYLLGSHWLVISIFFVTFVLHYKGDFMLLAVNPNKIYFVVIFYFICLRARENRSLST
ncbi:hypothetical protein [Marinobacter salexigens]|uniref:hypothetical protein n=1 Tax=Marinobacter salexigens TaxID=1925763 RepID=UPI0012902B8B|nr:hypothetical protein [Marinobacter salexigens]